MQAEMMAVNPKAMVPQQMPHSQFEYGSENPHQGSPDTQMQPGIQKKASGLTEQQEQETVQIITQYRNQWQTNRIEQMPKWLKNAEFDRGRQVLGWDPITRTYFDAVAWYRQNNQDTDYSYLEKYVNNITQTVRRNFVAAMARGVPPVVVMPENAENLADMTTSRAAQEAVSIIERCNDSKTLLRYEAQLLYLFGVYFKWTRFKIDGVWAGYKDEPVFSDVDVQTAPDRFHCSACGADSDATQMQMSDPGNLRCTNCGHALPPQSFFPGETEKVTQITAMRKIPNGMVKWSVYGPLQVDADPTAETIAETPLLALEMEVDVADLRSIYPDQAKKITEGAESSTDPNASYDRLVRTMMFTNASNMAADIFAARVTYSQVWVQPTCYWRTENDELRKTLQSLFPYGMKVCMVGNHVLDIRPAVIEKEWTVCKLHEGYGLYPPSVADNVVPFNERFNNVSNILDDYMERCATGITLADPKRIDLRELAGKPLTGGVLNPVPSVMGGQDQPLANSIYHFAFQLDPGLFSYLDRLWNYCQLISGVPPQVGGTGTMAGVETAKGQKQMLDQALGSLGVIWDNVKTEHANAGQNAIECLQKNMQYTGNLWNVIEENGSAFRNNYVHMDEMQGRVRVYPNTDEGLPMSPDQKRAWCENILEMAGENPAAQAWLDVPSNQELLSRYWGLPGSVTPGSAQQSKTLQDIRTLLQPNAKPTPMMDPKTGQPVMDSDGTMRLRPSLPPSKWVEDYPLLKSTVMEFCQNNSDLRFSNPVGWQNIIAYYRLACQYEAEVAGENNKLQMQAKEAAAPPTPEANPAVQQLEASLIQQTADAVDNLHQISHIPPALTGGTATAQVAASKELVDTAEKMLKAQGK